MTRKALEEAIVAAREFLRRANAYKANLDAEYDASIYDYRKLSSAVRRSSMELTRALAEWRRPSS